VAGFSGRGTIGRDDPQGYQALVVFERSKEFATSVLITAATTRSGTPRIPGA
jgi:hypothetical protein